MQGWDPKRIATDSDGLSVCEMGQALGNAWPLSVSSRIVQQLNKCIKWQEHAKMKLKLPKDGVRTDRLRSW